MSPTTIRKKQLGHRVLRTACKSSVLLLMCVAGSGDAYALSLREAIAVAVESNPQIGQAIENREAVEFELRQARGLYLPSLDLETSVGGRRLDNPTRRSLRIDNDTLTPADISIVATQKLFDGFGRRAEVRKQASRVDSASLRVLERSEFIGLQVAREYLEALLQAEIVAEAQRNLGVNRQIASDVGSGATGGTLTEADRQQSRERVLASQARLQEAQEEMDAAKIRFYALVAKPFANAARPPSVSAALPKSLEQAIGLGRTSNPQVRVARADVSTAEAEIKQARSRYFPEIFVEGRASTGHDVNGFEGRTTDMEARVVARWNLYRGGIDRANEQEQIRRAGEQRLVLHQTHRQVEEVVRASWDRRIKQVQLADILRRQTQANAQLVSSYRQQLAVGQRSLLDVLDAQNENFNSRLLATTAEYAALFAQYRLLAATGQLLDTLKIVPPKQADAYARTEFKVPEAAPTETQARMPSRQTNTLPLDLLAPIRN